MSPFLSLLKKTLAKEDSLIKTRGTSLFNNDDNDQNSYEKIDADKYVFEIYSQKGDFAYDVHLSFDIASNEIDGECDCAYFEKNHTHCKHIICAMLILQHAEIETTANELKAIPNLKLIKQNETKTYFTNWSLLTYHNIQQVSKRNQYFYQEQLWRTKRWKLIEDKDNKSVSFEYSTKIIPSITHIEKKQLEIKCQCKDINMGNVCEHAMILLYLLNREKTETYFLQFEDWTNEKNKILQQYGLTIGDKMATNFKFSFNYKGDITLVQKPANILSSNQIDSWKEIRNKLSIVVVDKPTLSADTKIEEYDKVAIQLSANPNEPCLAFQLVGIRPKKTGGGILYKKMSLRNSVSLPLLAVSFPEAASILTHISLDAAETMIRTPNSNWWEQFTSRQKSQWIIRYKNTFKKIAQLEHQPEILLEKDAKEYQEVFIKKESPVISIKISRENNFIEVEGLVELGKDEKIPLTKCKFQPWFLLQYENEYFVLEDDQIEPILLFSKNNLYIPLIDFDQFNKELLEPLSTKYSIEYDESMHITERDYVEIIPTLEINLGEIGKDYLTFLPQWNYDAVMLPYLENDIQNSDGGFITVKRNVDVELEYRTWIESLHGTFASRSKSLLYLPIQEALRDSWFFNFLQQAEEKNVKLIGKELLIHFNYNTAVPEINVKVGNGIDWFDVQIEVNYNGLMVSLADLKKAILGQQNFITLPDGSLGMIPSEWIEKYGYLLKSAKLKDDQLQVSKFQWTIIDALYDEVSDEKIADELKRKKELLLNIDKQNTYPVPKKLKATLRDYQYAGFQWLCTLDSLEWGACLADDMGLGKTLQTLSFLTHLKNKEPKTHLIVCPTSLIYNWESEILKFCKHLNYHIHYGVDRDKAKATESFSTYDIVITSYGMVRSDIKEFSKFKFDYVILDESHTIKNPAAQMAKAVSLLKCKNKIALSGTPLQNNTMDIYSQMNFLNPGMLGSIDSFKNEFATPIDKHGDKNKIELLRKILFPFMLRRTKEQVAKDLPDKTEMILWCEMEVEQRKIYNSFKEYYRKLIMNKIDEEGMNKSAFYILEGLLKLRQICDSPAILNDDVQYPNHSVKIEELTRELNENTGTHKALVFSQFVTMLKLIEAELIKNEIPYLYLDGSTKATERRNLVKEFQEEKTAKVMLISLKAGGVGLNLTEADYVYLVDPWWNPAVEQQAIDRTHRIGQTQKVFAYKMICKDSIEEKILMLQDKKKSLSADIISGETSFIKKLTRDDIKYLFS